MSQQSDTRLQEDVENLAAAIRARKLEVPVIFALEAYKPLVGVLRSCWMAMSPLLENLLGGPLYRKARHLLESPEAIELLIQTLEKRDTVSTSRRPPYGGTQ